MKFRDELIEKKIDNKEMKRYHTINNKIVDTDDVKELKNIHQEILDNKEISPETRDMTLRALKKKLGKEFGKK